MAINTRLQPRKDVKSVMHSIEYHLRYSLGKYPSEATLTDCTAAVTMSAREFVLSGLLNTAHSNQGEKAVYYLSLEFLIGRLLHNNLCNLGLLGLFEEACDRLGWQLSDVLENELDPALGNGGLGRLAACFLDSLATLGYPGYGYGINYEYGLFRQSFVNGYQRERPDHWTVNGTHWQIERVEHSCVVPLHGRIQHGYDTHGSYTPQWVNWDVLVGVPYDMPIVGYGGGTVNYLRLFSARSSDEFDMSIFNSGDYVRAVQQKISSETVSKLLYPSDAAEAGKELRLTQEYFFVACAIRDILRQHLAKGYRVSELPDRAAIQLNDTHPAMAVAELMRILVDEHSVSWDAAWSITTRTLAYTNHTLLPEALEKWPVGLVEYLLPRHIQIIYEINARFLAQVEDRFPNDPGKLQRMSILEEGEHRQVHMANLSIVGSHKVNGVAAMHTELVKTDLVPDFYQMWPDKFCNKTNGVTQRRWLALCNPGLSSLITEHIGDGWITQLDELRELEAVAGNPEFIHAFQQVKLANKRALAQQIKRVTQTEVDPSTLFDVQIKRIHEYKRQLLNALHIAHLYHRVVHDGARLNTPRTFIFAGKAAPGYDIAKLIIKFINSLGEAIEREPEARDQLRVVFFPDYKVSSAEKIIPAADVSEQVSTAGYEASGTGNMKLALNGALTVGTLDGANVEIREEVGDENIYIFGLTGDQVKAFRQDGYNPWAYYERNADIRRVLDSLAGDTFAPGDPGLFRPIFDLLTSGGDYYMHLADFEDYVRVQDTVSEDYRQPEEWARRAILNVARTGKFSSDRTIAEYASQIWHLSGKNRSKTNVA